MSKIQCPKCHAVFTSEALYCPNCGFKLEDAAIPYEEPRTAVPVYSQTKAEAVKKNTVPINRHNRETVAINRHKDVRQPEPNVYLTYKGNIISIDAEQFRIGADPETSNFVLNEKVISSDHADIIRHENRYYVKDLASTNGTYLNGMEIPQNREVEIRDQDNITFANVQTVFHSEEQE